MSKKKNRSNHYIYVVDRHGNPVMPSRRPGRIRHLMKEGKAVPISTHPFVVKLKYDIPGRTQPIHVGIDTGRENIGVGASRELLSNELLSFRVTPQPKLRRALLFSCVTGPYRHFPQKGHAFHWRCVMP